MTKTVQLETSAGTIRIELDDEKAPLSSANFLQYVKAGHYMIQGGGFEPGMKQRPTREPIANEAKNGLKNKHYTLAMARTSDPHSASAQFFINTTDNSFLDNDRAQDGWGYAVFGRVVGGTEVVDAIERVRTGRKGFHDDVPVDDVTIVRATEVV
jgi:peptidyl-prolyl cis-trans isomerase B (cyclophilin B)